MGDQNSLMVDPGGYRAACSFSYVTYVSYNLTVLKNDKITSVFVTPMSDWNRIKSYQNANRAATRVRKRVDINSSCTSANENSVSSCVIGKERAHHLGSGESGYCIVIANNNGNRSISFHLDYVFSNSENATYANAPDMMGVARTANANSTHQEKSGSNNASRLLGVSQNTMRYTNVVLCALSLLLMVMI
jgi:hypothetical protein